MKYFLRKNIIVIFLYTAFSFLVLSPQWFLHQGIPFRYDWTWPYFDLDSFGKAVFKFNNMGLMDINSRNMNLLLYLIGFLKLDTALLLRLLLLSIHTLSGYGFFLFIRKKVNSDLIAFVAGLAYAFSPYVFVRTIVGYLWSLTAYAIIPFFLHLYFNKDEKKIWDYFTLGLLLSLVFAQIQAGLLLTYFTLVALLVSVILRRCKFQLKTFIFTVLAFILANSYWLLLFLKNRTDEEGSLIVSGNAATTIGYMQMVPHSIANMAMLSDHQITAGFFYKLAQEPLYLIGFLLAFLVALFGLLNKKNKQLSVTILIAVLCTLPFSIGPTSFLSNFYTWFYNHFPQIAVFRETYHFQYLYAVFFCVLFALGLDWLWVRIDILKLKVESLKLKVILINALKALFAGSAVFIIAPYLTSDYAGYLKLQELPGDYYQLNNYLKSNSCSKIYYPPGLGFVYFKGDKVPAAANPDLIAHSIGIPFLDDGTTYSYLPSEERYYRNELVSLFYKNKDTGEFANLLSEGNIDCIVLKLDTDTKYADASNLGKETDPTILKKWNNKDLKDLVESKQGIKLEKQFGENIFIYKIKEINQKSYGRYQLEKELNVNKSAADQFSTNYQLPSTIFLPLTDWATNFVYYKDGWSRGRYDFWRKHLFTQLRQDFIYTDRPDSKMTGKIDQKGNFELWTRYLVGGTPGNLQFTINNLQFNLAKDSGAEKFVWKKLGEIKVDGKTDIEIKNINGENAITDLVLVKK